MNPEDALNDKKQHLKTWLERNKQNQEIVPLVNDELARTDWEIQVLQAVKNHNQAGAPLPIPDEINSQVEQSFTVWKNDLPLPPVYNPMVLTSLASAGTVTASEVYAFITQPGIPVQSKEYFSPYTRAYQQLQQTQNRPQEVLKRITALKFPELEDRFEKAQKAYYAYKTGTMENSAASSEIRNLLYSLNGYLLSRARNSPREQKMSWEEFAARLTFYGKAGHEYHIIVRQGEVYNQLIQTLSSGGKDIKAVDIEDIWTRVIDHIYIVLSSIKL